MRLTGKAFFNVLSYTFLKGGDHLKVMSSHMWWTGFILRQQVSRCREDDIWVEQM